MSDERRVVLYQAVHDMLTEAGLRDGGQSLVIRVGLLIDERDRLKRELERVCADCDAAVMQRTGASSPHTLSPYDGETL